MAYVKLCCAEPEKSWYIKAILQTKTPPNKGLMLTGSVAELSRWAAIDVSKITSSWQGMNMTELLFCDICGRSEKDFTQEIHTSAIIFQLDEDGLWLCSECRKNLTTSPTNQAVADDLLDERVARLIGKSAGAICRTENLPFVPPYQIIIEAASRIAYDEDRYMSAWSFVAQWIDGTTVWQSEDKREKAIVDARGNVQIEGRG